MFWRPFEGLNGSKLEGLLYIYIFNLYSRMHVVKQLFSSIENLFIVPFFLTFNFESQTFKKKKQQNFFLVKSSWHTDNTTTLFSRICPFRKRH